MRQRLVANRKVNASNLGRFEVTASKAHSLFPNGYAPVLKRSMETIALPAYSCLVKKSWLGRADAARYGRVAR